MRTLKKKKKINLKTQTSFILYFYLEWTVAVCFCEIHLLINLSFFCQVNRSNMKPWNAQRVSAQGTVHLTYGKTDTYSILILRFTFVRDSNVGAVVSKTGGRKKRLIT